LGSSGDGGGITSAGVVGKDEVLEDVGVGGGLVESPPGRPVATGKDKLKRFDLRGVYDSVRVCLTLGAGAENLAECALLGEGRLGGAVDSAPEVRTDRTEWRSTEERRRLWFSMAHIGIWEN
jgi:hypothetical protein